jgi:cell division protein ZipA
MLESLFTLRFVLLIIGALFVVGFYIWGSTKSRRNTRIKYDPHHARFDPPKRRSSLQAKTNPTRAKLEPSPAETVDDVVVADSEPIGELPTITREGDDESPPRPPRSKDAQLELTFDTEAAILGKSGAGEEPEEAIIAFYVRPPDGHEFAGPAIVRAMNSVGLRFGEMDIFHHFGAGELRADSPLFSVANMMEPGHFDLHEIENFATPGLAMILRLPGPLDGAVAFELFLNTAQRLAEALSGDLYGDPQTLLDSAMIDNMRRSAAPFANAG